MAEPAEEPPAVAEAAVVPGEETAVAAVQDEEPPPRQAYKSDMLTPLSDPIRGEFALFDGRYNPPDTTQKGGKKKKRGDGKIVNIDASVVQRKMKTINAGLLVIPVTENVTVELDGKKVTLYHGCLYYIQAGIKFQYKNELFPDGYPGNDCPTHVSMGLFCIKVHNRLHEVNKLAIHEYAPNKSWIYDNQFVQHLHEDDMSEHFFQWMRQIYPMIQDHSWQGYANCHKMIHWAATMKEAHEETGWSPDDFYDSFKKKFPKAFPGYTEKGNDDETEDEDEEVEEDKNEGSGGNNEGSGDNNENNDGSSGDKKDAGEKNEKNDGSSGDKKEGEAVGGAEVGNGKP